MSDIKAIRNALGLLSSMVSCGEGHSDTSRSVVGEAHAALDRLSPPAQSSGQSLEAAIMALNCTNEQADMHQSPLSFRAGYHAGLAAAAALATQPPAPQASAQPAADLGLSSLTRWSYNPKRGLFRHPEGDLFKIAEVEALAATMPSAAPSGDDVKGGA